jgi:hypothetical protein
MCKSEGERVMSVYETAFYWVGVVSTIIFCMLGITTLTAWILNMVWARFKDGKKLMDVIAAYRKYEKYEMEVSDE